jgi:hypothetical protein
MLWRFYFSLVCDAPQLFVNLLLIQALTKRTHFPKAHSFFNLAAKPSFVIPLLLGSLAFRFEVLNRNNLLPLQVHDIFDIVVYLHISFGRVAQGSDHKMLCPYSKMYPKCQRRLIEITLLLVSVLFVWLIHR